MNLFLQVFFFSSSVVFKSDFIIQDRLHLERITALVIL